VQKKTAISVIAVLAALAKRAERACEMTTKLVRDYNFLVVWYGRRPRSRMAPDPLLDESDRETHPLRRDGQDISVFGVFARSM